MTAAAWTARVAREPLSRAARLLVAQLADRADRRGRVNVPLAAVAACACLSPDAAAADRRRARQPRAGRRTPGVGVLKLPADAGEPVR